MCKDHKIRSFLKPRTIISMMRNGKDPIRPFDRQGPVYCVPCGDCNQIYTGGTEKL